MNDPTTAVSTHAVLNQVPPLVGYNLFASDRALSEGVERECAGWATAELTALGSLLGSERVIALGFQANENRPVLRTHDRFGNRIDEVEFHPAWHEMMRIAMAHGAHCRPWSEPRGGAHVARAATSFMLCQIDAGHACPITMTFAVPAALRKQPEIAAEWEPKLFAREYDSRFRPVREKSSALMGMGMTEKQGGSDVRANTTRAAAVREGGPGAEYLLTGHKWFCSAPMCDAFLVLAQAPGGLSCFFVPRWTPDGERNRFFIQRLKNKLGNHSNASSEVEFNGAWGRMVGAEGRGVPVIIEMVNLTRLECVVGSSALMRQATAQAVHHATHRSAFGKRLLDQPLMRNVLADLCIESEAATALALRLARAYDHAEDEEFEGPLRRFATAAAKYWVCKRAVTHVGEALECLGGNGYVEECVMPRLLREAPLNSIWEGSGNVMCLDVLRAMTREPASLDAMLAEIKLARGADKRLDAFVGQLERDLRANDAVEPQARALVERVAIAMQGSLLVRHSIAPVADAFCASRLEGRWGNTFGTLGAGTDFGAIIERGAPVN